jgi:hypothetical protein
MFAGAVESYPAGGVFCVAESASDAFDLFDEAVVAPVRALVMPVWM